MTDLKMLATMKSESLTLARELSDAEETVKKCGDALLRMRDRKAAISTLTADQVKYFEAESEALANLKEFMLKLTHYLGGLHKRVDRVVTLLAESK